MTATVLRVVPSGDTTGATDVVAINAAIATVAATNTGVVVLAGQYYINDTIRVRSYATRTSKPVLLCGVNARINVATGMTGLYAVEYYGASVHDTTLPRLSGLHIECNKLCRGVLMHYQAYVAAMRDVYVKGPIGVGIDLVDCWGSSLQDVVVRYARGICLRMWRCHSSVLSNVKLQGYGAYNSIDEAQTTLHTQAASAAMWTYQQDNGYAAAVAYYDGTEDRGTYTEQWPAVDETYILDSGGSYVVTAAVERAGLVCDITSASAWHGVNLEFGTYLHYPQMHVKTGKDAAITAVRLENCRNYGPRFVLQDCEDVQLSQVYHYPREAVEATYSAPYLLGLRGTTHHVAILGGTCGNAITTNVAYAEDGSHTGVTIERLSTDIVTENYLDAAVGAVITTEAEAPT